MLELLTLGLDECRQLLGSGVVGRLIVCTPEGPHVMPVNYALLDDHVALRTGRDGVVGRNAPGSVVAFSVDQVDYERQHGWSVTVRGVCEEVRDAGDIERIRGAAPSPWAAGSRDLVLRMPCSHVTGRVLGHGWEPLKEMPIHRHLGTTPDRCKWR